MQNLDFLPKFRKISNFVKISRKPQWCSKFLQSSDFVQNMLQFQVRSIFWKNLDLLKNLDFGPRFRKVSIFVKKNRKIPILVKISEKFKFWSKMSQISIMVKILEKLRFGSNF